MKSRQLREPSNPGTLIRAGLLDPKNERELDRMENGEICTICKGEFDEDYGRPIACENCGGDGVLSSGDYQI